MVIGGDGVVATTSDPPVYLLHGLRVRSGVPLDALVARVDTWDLEISWGERRQVPDTVPEGRLLAYLQMPDGCFSLSRTRVGVTHRIHGLCDLELSDQPAAMSVHLAPSADEELGSLFVGGALATWLTMHGCCVLHASAVETGDRVVAVVGASGMGKTTLAALFCGAGACLVTDDMLRIEREEGRGWCFTGTTELRLRSAAAGLVDTFPDSPHRRTIDQRFAVEPAVAGSGRLSLDAILVPEPTHDSERLRVERLPAPEALMELVRFPRAPGWIDSGPIRHSFATLAELVAVVPVYRATLPWGPPFQPDLAHDVLNRIGLRMGDSVAHS